MVLAPELLSGLNAEQLRDVVTDLIAQVARNDQEISARNLQINALDQQIASLDQTISSKDREILSWTSHNAQPESNNKDDPWNIGEHRTWDCVTPRSV